MFHIEIKLSASHRCETSLLVFKRLSEFFLKPFGRRKKVCGVLRLYISICLFIQNMQLIFPNRNEGGLADGLFYSTITLKSPKNLRVSLWKTPVDFNLLQAATYKETRIT